MRAPAVQLAGRTPTVPPEMPSVCTCGRTRRLLLTTLLFAAPFAVLTPICSALDPSDVTSPGVYSRPLNTTRIPGLHAAHGDLQNSRPLIDQVRFNQTSLSFEHGITVGPAPGNLEIQFSAPPPGASDRLSYRLLGFDNDWKETGLDRTALYSHLAPGRYEFDFQQVATDGARGSVVKTIPLTVVAPFWQTERFRSLTVFLLLLLIFVLHKLRIRFLKRHVKKLEQAVSLTKVELTLAARIAGDAQEALKEQALKDGLTGLWNRRAIFAMLEREIYRAQRDRFAITLVMIDLDHFKDINDTWGHLTGDEVLREAAGRLSQVMRPYDFAGRYGGEEFLVVLPSCPQHNGPQRAEDFRRAIAERPFPTSRGPIALTCSLGVAAYDNLMLPEDLIHRADEALYRAKNQGRNCVCAGI